MLTKSFFAKCLRYSVSHRYFHTPTIVVREYDLNTAFMAELMCVEFMHYFPCRRVHCSRAGSIVTFIVTKCA